MGPSTVDTDMCHDYLKDQEIREKEIQANPMKRLGTEKQIGDAVVFLASDEAMQVNGHLLMVDGGLTVKARTTRRPYGENGKYSYETRR